MRNNRIIIDVSFTATAYCTPPGTNTTRVKACYSWPDKVIGIVSHNLKVLQERVCSCDEDKTTKNWAWMRDNDVPLGFACNVNKLLLQHLHRLCCHSNIDEGINATLLIYCRWVSSKSSKGEGQRCQQQNSNYLIRNYKHRLISIDWGRLLWLHIHISSTF